MDLKIIHFFPKQLNLYGDRGNILALKKRGEWYGINVSILEIHHANEANFFSSDLFFIGGGSDREQGLVTKELSVLQSDFSAAIEDGLPGLAVCGGYQFLGEYYQTQEGTKLKGLGIVDLYTVSSEKRMVGNIFLSSDDFGDIVGFENHSGKTYHNLSPLGKVKRGYGNNGMDHQEGLRYKNIIGTYLHGPLLPKNYKITDYLLTTAIERKYGVKLQPLTKNEVENAAKKQIIEKINF